MRCAPFFTPPRRPLFRPYLTNPQTTHLYCSYNFRFEDPSGGAIVTHARGAGAEASLRRKENKRKEERERKRAREAEALREAEEETRRLMNLKRGELRKQAGAIAAVAGEVPAEELEALLEGDWDPAAHDARMAALFGDTYYGQEEGVAVEEAVGGGEGGGGGGDEERGGRKEKKRVAPWVYGDGPRPAWAGPDAEALAAGVDDGLGTLEEYEGGGGGAGEAEEEEKEEEEGEEGGGDEADPAVVGRRRARKAGRRKAKAARIAGATARVRAALAAERGAGAAGLGRADDTDAVLALGFEDVIAGGLRTRFKYVQVKPERFGLAPEELLHADDEDLGNLVSLRKLAPYRDKEWHVPYKTKGRALADIKKKVAARLAAAEKPNAAGGGAWEGAAGAEKEEDGGAVREEEAEGGGGAGAGADEGEGAAKKKRKRRHKKNRAAEEEGEVEGGGDGEENAAAAAAAAAAATAATIAAAKEERREEKRKRRKVAEDAAAAAAAAAAAPVTLPTGAVVSAARFKSFGF